MGGRYCDGFETPRSIFWLFDPLGKPGSVLDDFSDFYAPRDKLTLLHTDPGLYDEADPSDRSVDVSVAVVEDIFDLIPGVLMGCAAPIPPRGEEEGNALAYGVKAFLPGFELPPRIEERPSTYDKGDWDEFIEAWHTQLERWWLQIPIAQRAFLKSCSSALGLSLASRLDWAFKLHFWSDVAAAAPPPPSSELAEDCKWVPAAVEEIEVPSFPHLREDFRKLELRRFLPIPKLMPKWPRWHRLDVPSGPTASTSNKGTAGASAISSSERSGHGIDGGSFLSIERYGGQSGLAGVAGEALPRTFNATALAAGAAVSFAMMGLVLAVALRMRLYQPMRCLEFGPSASSNRVACCRPRWLR